MKLKDNVQCLLSTCPQCYPQFSIFSAISHETKGLIKVSGTTNHTNVREKALGRKLLCARQDSVTHRFLLKSCATPPRPVGLRLSHLCLALNDAPLGQLPAVLADHCAPGRTRTYNNWFEASRDIHFTTGAWLISMIAYLAQKNEDNFDFR